MHTGVQMKCVSKLTDARRTSRGRWLFPTRLWDFIRERKNIMFRLSKSDFLIVGGKHWRLSKEPDIFSKQYKVLLLM